jgi:hypothetical protein
MADSASPMTFLPLKANWTSIVEPGGPANCHAAAWMLAFARLQSVGPRCRVTSRLISGYFSADSYAIRLAGTLPLKVSVAERPKCSAAAGFKEWGVNNVQNKYMQSNPFGSRAGSAAVFSQEAGLSDAAVQAFGSFVKTRTDSGVKQGATNSGGVLASYRFFSSDSHGVERNYRYSLNTQTYGLAA